MSTPVSEVETNPMFILQNLALNMYEWDILEFTGTTAETFARESMIEHAGVHIVTGLDYPPFKKEGKYRYALVEWYFRKYGVTNVENPPDTDHVVSFRTACNRFFYTWLFIAMIGLSMVIRKHVNNLLERI